MYAQKPAVAGAYARAKKLLIEWKPLQAIPLRSSYFLTKVLSRTALGPVRDNNFVKKHGLTLPEAQVP